MKSKLPNTLFKFTIHFLLPYKMQMLSLIAFASMIGCYGTISSYIIKILIDSMNTTKPILEIKFLPAIFLVINFAAHSVAWRGLHYINIKIAPKIKNSIIEQMFAYVHKHSYKFFQDNFSGSIANNIVILADNIEGLAMHTSIFIIRGFVQLLLALITMYFVHPAFSLALFIWVSIFIIFSAIYSNRVKELSNQYAESQSLLSGKIIDSISNTLHSKLFAREEFEFYYLQKSLNLMKTRFQDKEWFLLKFWLINSLSIIILISIVIFILIILRIHHLVTIGDFAFILGLVLCVTENIWELTEQLGKLNDVVGKCKQSLKVIIVMHEVVEPISATPLLVNKGEIIFDYVHFSYKDKDAIFQNNSVKIIAGQKVGLVGYSGGGKSTFINLILRLFDVSSGRILIDDQDIRDVTQNSLRSAIGVIPQEPSLFCRTLMENIRYGRLNATDSEVIEAAKKAHADKFIQQLPEGYGTLVGERGVKLSGGQRQRIAIARAILKNAPILILDEATSQLDSLTEKNIQESLWKLMQSKTTIIIAHRLSTLLEMDRILVFDQGRIVEDGTHQNLLKESKLYKTLWDSQVGGFLPEKPSAIV